LFEEPAGVRETQAPKSESEIGIPRARNAEFAALRLAVAVCHPATEPGLGGPRAGAERLPEVHRGPCAGAPGVAIKGHWQHQHLEGPLACLRLGKPQWTSKLWRACAHLESAHRSRSTQHTRARALAAAAANSALTMDAHEHWQALS
jgi:hypothetical protein